MLWVYVFQCLGASNVLSRHFLTIWALGLSIRFQWFLRAGRSELTKINVSERWTLSVGACAAKSTARYLDVFFEAILWVAGLAGNH